MQPKRMLPMQPTGDGLRVPPEPLREAETERLRAAGASENAGQVRE
jgi:hypothetical protein